MKKTLNLNYTRKIHITCVVILTLFVLSVFVSYQIGVMQEEAAWGSLKRSANRVDEELTRRVDIDREVLLTLADIISRQEQLEGPVVQEIITGNNKVLEELITRSVSEKVNKNMDFLLQAKERQEEDRFRKLDHLIRQQQNSRREAARPAPVRYLHKIFGET